MTHEIDLLQSSYDCMLIKLMKAFLEIGFVEMDIAIGIMSLKSTFCEYDFFDNTK